MPAGVLLTMVLMAPTPAAPAVPRDRKFGRLHFTTVSTLQWPGLYLPAFTLAPDRRMVHRFTLGLDLPGLRGLSFHAAGVEPSQDPGLFSRTAGMPSGEGNSAYVYTGLRMQVPKTQWQVGVGRSWVVGAAKAAASAVGGRAGLWRVDLIRPLR